MYCRFQLHARTLFLAVLLFAAAACVARPTEAKKTVKFQVPIEKAYEGIRVSSMVSVVLDDRDPSSVEVTTDARLADNVAIGVNRGVLEIRMKEMRKQERKRRKNEDFVPTVVYVGRGAVCSAELDGMAKLTSEKGLAGDRVAVSVTGMSKVDMPLECVDATIRVSGMSKIDSRVQCSGRLRLEIGGMSKASLKGEASRLEAEVIGMSKLSAGELTVTEYADCAVGGMGKADVTCEGELKARTEGMSKLSYGGNCTLADGSEISDSSLKKR